MKGRAAVWKAGILASLLSSNQCLGWVHPAVSRRIQLKAGSESDSDLGMATAAALPSRPAPRPMLGGSSPSKVQWPRRLISRVFQRKRRLRMVTPVVDEMEQTERVGSKSTTNGTEFISRNFHTLSPSDVLEPSLTSRKREMAISLEDIMEGTDLAGAVEAELEELESGMSRNSRSRALLSRFTGNWAETTLTSLIDRWTQGRHEGMAVQCDATGGVVELIRGRFHADATLDFDRLILNNIRTSQGRIQSRRMALNIYKFAPFCKRIPRFASSFDLVAEKLTFTADDLFESNSIRNGLSNILSNVLNSGGISSSGVEITSIKVIEGGKISCIGQAKTVFDSMVSFEVRSGLDYTNRGHVLTFPGMEISLNPSLGLFVPIVPTLSLDMGHNAQILDLSLDPKAESIQLSCRISVTPRHTRKVFNKYEQSKRAFSSTCHFDVGRWVTRIGNFSN